MRSPTSRGILATMRYLARYHFPSALAAAVFMAGCGGSNGGGLAVNEPPVPPAVVESGTARFDVDLETGAVRITELKPSSRTVFAGSSVQFSSSSLINEGALGRRRLTVSLKNSSQETMVGPLKLHFRNFANVTSVATDLRPLHNILSIAGDGTTGGLDGPAGSSSFAAPQAVVSDDNGSIYFTVNDGTIRRLKNGVVSTVVTGLSQPRGLVYTKLFENRESLFFAEAGTHRIKRVSLSTFSVDTFAGSGSAGTADNSSLSLASFNAPSGLALSSESSNSISLVSTDSGAGTARSIRSLVNNPSGTGVNTLATGLTNPRGIATQGSITAIANTGANSIRVISGGQTVNMGSLGFLDGTGDLVQFSGPRDVALRFGTLYVADTGNHRIRQAQLRPGSTPGSAPNWLFATIAGNGTAGFTDGEGSLVRLSSPTGVNFADNGQLLIADEGNNRLRRIVSTGSNFPVDIPTGGISTAEKPRLANPTTYVPGGDGRTPVIEVATPATLASGVATAVGNWDFIVPSGITAFSFTVEVEAGTSLLAPPDAVSNAGPTNPGGSTNVRVRGFAGADPGFADGPLASAAFRSVSGITSAENGTIFVADADNHAVRRISASGNVTTIAGRPGVPGFTDGRGDVALLTSPTGIACEPDGKTIYVVQKNTVLRIELRADFDEQDANGVTLGDPASAASYTVSTIAGLTNTAGFANGSTGDGSRFNDLTGIVRTGDGQLFVTEGLGKRVRSLSAIGSNRRLAASWQVLTAAGDGTVTTPAAGTVDGTGPSARFSLPLALTLAPDGFLFVVDSSAHRIRRVETSGTTTTVAGSVAGYGDASIPLSAKFQNPSAITVDSSNTFYIGDRTNQAIRRFGNGVQSVAGTGVAGTAEGTGRTAQFRNIRSIHSLQNGDILVGDEGRIRLIQRIVSTAKP